MHERFARFPAALEPHVRRTRLEGVPTLLVHPAFTPEGHADDTPPAACCVWMHGRTVSKDLDPGRYLRWLRAGIATIAFDLPGHGERAIDGWDSTEHTPRVISQMASEIDRALQHLASSPIGHLFDLDPSPHGQPPRVGIGGMSAGGMATLVYLTSPDRAHRFNAVCLESTTGDLTRFWLPDPATGRPRMNHDPAFVDAIDPARRLERDRPDGDRGEPPLFRPKPVQVLHSEADRIVQWDVQLGFVDQLRGYFAAHGADPDLIEVTTWPETGAPGEHAGFGRVAAEAKSAQVDFLTRCLRPSPAEH